ncbi:MAG: PCRF domain-containing protein [Sphingorhabdus sp.]
MIERPVIIDIGYIIGGDEGHVLVEMLLSMFIAWAEQQSFVHELLEKAPAIGGGLKYAKIVVNCADAESVSDLHAGAHTMIRIPPDDLNQRRHMSSVGVRISDHPDLPLPEKMADWGDERRRYFYDPYRAITDARLGRLEVDPDHVFAGDFSALEGA